MNDPQIVVIGEECKVLKPIEILFAQSVPRAKGADPKWYIITDFDEIPQRIELIAKDYDSDGYDLIFAIPISKTRSSGRLYLGHWNDGIYKKFE